MMKFIPTACAAIAVAAALSGCVDEANAPMLVPVGTPSQAAKVAHVFCVGEANEAYKSANEEFDKRARMVNQFTLTTQAGYQRESQAKSAARAKYLSCVASQGYRPIY